MFSPQAEVSGSFPAGWRGAMEEKRVGYWEGRAFSFDPPELDDSLLCSHGLRRGLHSDAAPRLALSVVLGWLFPGMSLAVRVVARLAPGRRFRLLRRPRGQECPRYMGLRPRGRGRPRHTG
jgi:hypothetical protein